MSTHTFTCDLHNVNTWADQLRIWGMCDDELTDTVTINNPHVNNAPLILMAQLSKVTEFTTWGDTLCGKKGISVFNINIIVS